MAEFNAAHLSAVGYANGFTLWHYRTEDSAVDLEEPGYFNDAHKMMRAGDFIAVNGHTIDGRPGHAMLVVTRSTADGVETMVGMRVQP